MGNNNSKKLNSNLTPEEPQLPELPELENLMIDSISYCLSNSDLDDIDRQHLNIFVIKHLFQSNFSAPVEDRLIRGCEVLDVACGPGTWLLDLASIYEKSSFYGLDIKSIFPQEIKPNNLQFIEADMFNGLPFYDNEFDFTHIGTMVNILTTDQWDFVISELLRVTKPGGYIEITELCLNKVGNKTPVFYEIYKGFVNSCLKRNVNIRSIIDLDSVIELKQNVGNVHRDERFVTFGPKGGKPGLIYQEIVMQFISRKSPIKDLSTELGISEEEFEQMIEDLKEEFKQNNSSKAHIIRFWAQKIIN